jgi:hypothetical protein
MANEKVQGVSNASPKSTQSSAEVAEHDAIQEMLDEAMLKMTLDAIARSEEEHNRQAKKSAARQAHDGISGIDRSDGNNAHAAQGAGAVVGQTVSGGQ